MLDKIARFLKPVTTEISLGFDAIAVVRENRIDIFIAEFAAQKFAAEERWVTNDDIALRPFAFGIKFQRIVSAVFASLRFFQ